MRNSIGKWLVNNRCRRKEGESIGSWPHLIAPPKSQDLVTPVNAALLGREFPRSRIFFFGMAVANYSSVGSVSDRQRTV